jgi:hypothetical protein
MAHTKMQLKDKLTRNIFRGLNTNEENDFDQTRRESFSIKQDDEPKGFRIDLFRSQSPIKQKSQ